MRFKLIAYLGQGNEELLPCEDVSCHPSLNLAREDAEAMLRGENHIQYIEIYDNKQLVDILYAPVVFQ